MEVIKTPNQAPFKRTDLLSEKTPTLGARRSTHLTTLRTSPVDYNLMIFSQLKLKGFKIMTKTDDDTHGELTDSQHQHNMSWQRRLNLR